MKIEVLNTGTELLLGAVVNAHLKFLAEALFPFGQRIQRQVTVPDGDPIREALLETFERADVVFVTGGLGPTTDDVTREITADLLGLELVHDDEIMQAIDQRFSCRGLAVEDRVSRQALRPRGSIVLQNEHGTAPGLYIPRNRSLGSPHIFLLPGPPRELQPMFESGVLPILRNLLPRGPEVAMRSFRVVGLGESTVEARVGQELLNLGVELGYCARPGEVDVRAIGEPAQLQQAERIIRANLDGHIASTDDRALENVVVDLLAGAGATLATAESCTGGLLGHRVTNVAGASRVYIGGYVAYANQQKTRALGISPELIRARGAVSQEVAAAMARGALKVTGADYALATTGIAGPGGGTETKPVGTVYVAFAAKAGGGSVELHRFPTDRETFKLLASQASLDLLRRVLEGNARPAAATAPR